LYNKIKCLGNGIKCGVYHSEISLKQRNIVHEQFVKNSLKIVVATMAFGMGIDKSGNCLMYCKEKIIVIRN